PRDKKELTAWLVAAGFRVEMPELIMDKRRPDFWGISARKPLSGESAGIYSSTLLPEPHSRGWTQGSQRLRETDIEAVPRDTLREPHERARSTRRMLPDWKTPAPPQEPEVHEIPGTLVERIKTGYYRPESLTYRI